MASFDIWLDNHRDCMHASNFIGEGEGERMARTLIRANKNSAQKGSCDHVIERP